MKLDNQELTAKLAHASTFLHKHAATLCIVIFGAMYVYILFTVSNLAQTQPSATDVKNQPAAVPSPRIDEDVAETMLNLEDRNVKVQAIFNEARNNPFTE